MTEELEHLAELIRAKNEADLSIARLLGRPALSGNIGEFVAARVFGIDFDAVGVPRGVRRRLLRAPLAGRTVNIKTYSRNEWILDIGKHPCDYYLVPTGPPGQAPVRPWVIESVHLFDSLRLIPQLQQLGIKIGVATSVRKQSWEASRIFPARQGSPLDITDDQIAALTFLSLITRERMQPRHRQAPVTSAWSRNTPGRGNSFHGSADVTHRAPAS